MNFSSIVQVKINFYIKKNIITNVIFQLKVELIHLKLITNA
jgi:hypothetical protein